MFMELVRLFIYFINSVLRVCWREGCFGKGLGCRMGVWDGGWGCLC